MTYILMYFLARTGKDNEILKRHTFLLFIICLHYLCTSDRIYRANTLSLIVMISSAKSDLFSPQKTLTGLELDQKVKITHAGRASTQTGREEPCRQGHSYEAKPLSVNTSKLLEHLPNLP